MQAAAPCHYRVAHRRLATLVAVPLLGSLLAGTAGAAPLPLCPVTDGMVASYDIVRGGSVIGRHTVQFARQGQDLTVTIAVNASLSALGIRVYRYEHTGREVWRDGKMVAMQTRTQDDGDKQQVDAVFDPARGTWSGTAATTPVSGGLMASSFWNSLTVRQTRFLDDESGKIVPVQVTPAGREALTLNGSQVSASKFDLVGTMSGSVWYDDNGCWVRALFHSPVDGSLVDVRSRG